MGKDFCEVCPFLWIIFLPYMEVSLYFFYFYNVGILAVCLWLILNCLCGPINKPIPKFSYLMFCLSAVCRFYSWLQFWPQFNLYVLSNCEVSRLWGSPMAWLIAFCASLAPSTLLGRTGKIWSVYVYGIN